VRIRGTINLLHTYCPCASRASNPPIEETAHMKIFSAIALFFFSLGAVAGAFTADIATSSGDVVLVEKADITVIAAVPATTQKLFVDVSQPLPQLAPVRNIHAGERKPVPQDPTKRCPQWEPLFAKYGLPVETFSYIAWRESRCRRVAINATWDKAGNMTWALNNDKSWDSGIIQVNSSWIRSVRLVCGVDTGNKRKDLEALFNPECNVKFARWIIDNTQSGLGNWNM